MKRYFTRKDGLPYVECTKEEYVQLEKFVGIHVGDDEPTSCGFMAKGFEGTIKDVPEPKKHKIDDICEAFLKKGSL